MSASEVKVFDRHSYGGALSFRIPRSILSSMVTYVDDVVMQVVPYNTDALKLLAGMQPRCSTISHWRRRSSGVPQSIICTTLLHSRLAPHVTAWRRDAQSRPRGCEWQSRTSSRTATGVTFRSARWQPISG